MSRSILITYATRAGTTGEVAHIIADVLRREDVWVDVRNIQDVTDLARYDAVVIGSATRMGSWIPEAVAWVAAHAEVLARLPVALVTMTGLLGDEQGDAQQAVYSATDEVRQYLSPVDEVFFAGKVAVKKLPYFER
ncbi:MAG: flavodoxin, partial [Chloroflexi bacterium]|nr:flavodoxin [Chloroflexota bacterium]